MKVETTGKPGEIETACMGDYNGTILLENDNSILECRLNKGNAEICAPAIAYMKLAKQKGWKIKVKGNYSDKLYLDEIEAGGKNFKLK